MRDNYYDNVKGFLVFLVVFGHFIGVNLVWHGQDLHYLVYAFHMPAFIFLAGYFSKKESWRDTIKKCFFQLFLPYVIFQIVYQYLFTTQFNHPLTFHWDRPHYTLWFLVSLICWKFLLQLAIRWKGFLVLFLVLWFGHRYWMDDMRAFSIGRTISFLPYFLLGFYWKTLKNKWQSFSIASFLSRFAKPIGFIGFASIVLMYGFDVITIPVEWFYGLLYYPVDYANEGVAYLLLYQTYVFFFSLLMVVFFMMMIPKSTSIWTVFGKTSLSIYLFHGFIAQLLKINGFVIKTPTVPSLIIVVVITYVTLVVLSQPFFGRFIQQLTHWGHPDKEKSTAK